MEADDDMPASIPFEPVEKDVVERVDVSDLEEETSVSGAADRADPSDPFAGPFDSEELVIDRYVAFESELLQAAPHVVNRVDAAFAGDLNQASAFAAAAALADAEALAADGPDAESPALTDDVQPTDLPDETSDGVVSAFQTSTAETLSAEEPGEDRVQFEAGDEADRNSDEEGERVVIATSVDPARQELLVVEDDGRETPQVVSARQFRRLFSDLESAQVRQA